MATERERARQLERALAGRTATSEIDDELASLLRQAQALQRLEPARPPRAFISAARYRIMKRIKAGQVPRPARLRRASWIPWPRLRRPALALASLALALVLLLSGTGIAYAASASLPGDPLYAVKQTYERTRLALAIREHSQVRLLHQFANRRLEEIQALERSQRAEDLPIAVANYDQAMIELGSALEHASDSQLEEVQQSLDHHQQVLQSILERAPEAAAPGLENALQKSAHNREVLEALEEGRSPSEQAPGQQKKETTTEPSEEQVPPGQEQKGSPGPPGDTPPGQEKQSSPGPPGGTPPGQQNRSSTPGPPPEKGPPEGQGGGRPDNPGGGGKPD